MSRLFACLICVILSVVSLSAIGADEEIQSEIKVIFSKHQDDLKSKTATTHALTYKFDGALGSTRLAGIGRDRIPTLFTSRRLLAV